MEVGLLLAGAALLAYANGANDNFKVVATLYGSRTLSYRAALILTTVATLLGAVVSLSLAQELVRTFSGKGLVGAEVLADPGFLTSVGLGAGATVLGAALAGLPISTTHAITGALVGAGLVWAGAVDLAQLGGAFVLPLLVSPILALVGTALFHPLLKRALGVGSEAGALEVEPEDLRPLTRLDAAHVLSAGVLAFARGVHDTPKIAALLVAAPALGLVWSSALVAVVMAAGGLLTARRVAETMSHRITTLYPTQGFAANLVSAALMIVASRLGVPVSTTHVTCGALFGIGATTGQASRPVILKIALAWIATLPIGAGLAALAALALR